MFEGTGACGMRGCPELRLPENSRTHGHASV